MEVYNVVFTGGPCSGKSTTIEKVAEILRKMDYTVYVVSETAREVIKSGILPNSDDPNYTLKFQNHIMNLQNVKENKTNWFANYKPSKNPTIVLHDRAIPDGKIYLSSEKEFNSLLKSNSLNYYRVFDRYDLVIDLISLASVDYLKYENDNERFEDKETAKLLDEKATKIYLPHRNLKIVLPTEDINDKVKIVLYYILTLVNNIDIEDKKIAQPHDRHIIAEAIGDYSRYGGVQLSVTEKAYEIEDDKIMIIRKRKKEFTDKDGFIECEIFSKKNKYHKLYPITEKQANALEKKYRLGYSEDSSDHIYVDNFNIMNARLHIYDDEIMMQEPISLEKAKSLKLVK